MSTTVQTGGFEITSNHESASAMVESLTPAPKKEGVQVIRDKGKDAEEPEKEGLSKHASELGKKGGAAAAKARQEREAPKVVKDKGVEAKTEEAEPDEAEQARRKVGEEIEAEPDPAKRRQLASERVKEATRRAAEERRRADALEVEVQRLRTAPPAPQQAPAQPQVRQEEVPRRVTAEDAPRDEDFETYPEFVRATVRFEQQLIQQEQEREQFAHQYAAKVTQGIDSFRAKVRAAIEADPTIEEHVIPFKHILENSSHNVPPGQAHTAFNAVNDFIMESETPGPLMKYLKTHPPAVLELCRLPDRESIARKMGRIEASLEGATTGTPAPRRAVSQAPPPVRPVTGSPHIAEPDLMGDMSFEEYVAKSRGRKRA